MLCYIIVLAGLVLDIGASGVRISPVADGFVLKKSIISTSRGGDWLDKMVAEELNSKFVSIFSSYNKSCLLGLRSK